MFKYNIFVVYFTFRYSTDGVLPGSHTCDTVGPMAHFIEDLQLLDRILSKQDEPIKGFSFYEC